ncbi:MAG: hypothetical protein M1816_002149 [Peltula sp. TS41687]|nr:MAG: hypothetical protein M1816_002149 [Peltula sp. TS41687]
MHRRQLPTCPCFTEDQQDWIQQLVSRSIQNAVTTLAAQPTPLQHGSGRGQPPDLPPPPRDGRTTSEPVINVIKDDGQSSFKPEVAGYFQPDLPSSDGKDDIVYSGKETIYRDVHAFVDRLSDMLPVYGAPAKHEPADYVYEITRRAKAGFDQTIQQLTYAITDFNRRGPSQGPPYGYNSRPNYTPDARTPYRCNTPYRPYYDNLPYMHSIERTGYNETTRSYTIQPYAVESKDIEFSKRIQPNARLSSIYEARVAAYHADKKESPHLDRNYDYDNMGYEAYEQGFFEGQNAAYWTQEATSSRLKTAPTSIENLTHKEWNTRTRILLRPRTSAVGLPYALHLEQQTAQSPRTIALPQATYRPGSKTQAE